MARHSLKFQAWNPQSQGLSWSLNLLISLTLGLYTPGKVSQADPGLVGGAP